MSSPFEAVLWDLDGTLLDSIALIVAGYHHTLAAHDLPPRSDAEILSGLGTTLVHQFENWGHGDQKEALVATYVDFNLESHDALARPYEGLKEIVSDLQRRGIPQALVTSKRRLGGEKSLKLLGLQGVFGAEIYGDEVERSKPDPEPVRRALEGLGMAASKRIAFVGDASHDIDAGKAAGVYTVGVTWGSGREAELASADAIVSNAQALRELLG